MPKSKPPVNDGLTKAERQALKRREAQLMAELEERAKPKTPPADGIDYSGAKRKQLVKVIADKSNPKALRKAAKAELARRGERPLTVEPAKPLSKAEREAKAPSAKVRVEAAADKVIAEPGSEGAVTAAKTAKVAASEADEAETDADIRARVLAKRDRRKALEDEDYRAGIDRDDAEAVRTYNTELAALGGGRFLSSTDEVAKAVESVSAKPKSKTKGEFKPGVHADAVDGDPVKRKPKAAPKQTVEPVETEEGTIYEAGAATPEEGEEFGKPSEAPLTDFGVNGNGQYKVKRPEDGKLVGYTRVTTYINNLEDEGGLTKWKLRILLEGVALNDTATEHPEELPDSVVAMVSDLVHRRDVTIAKARKADRKGKLAFGELAEIVEGEWRVYKRELGTLAGLLLDLGGVHEKADKGTDIHALCELYDREGIDAVGELLTEGKITRSDLADVEAYARAIADAGIKIIPELIERPIVVDDLKVAGRLDRGVLYKFPGTARAVRCVADIKTGRVDLGAGKIAQQLEMYSRGQGYDLNTHEREDIKLSKTKALLIHLPAGSGTCTIHVVDLTVGRAGNELSGKVRAWRNEGKRAYSTSEVVATS